MVEEATVKIAVYGATGNVGSAIVGEAVARGHEVTGLSRRAGTVDGARWQHGDAGDPASVREVAGTHDAVVSAIGPSREPGADGQPYLDAIGTLADQVGDTRLVVVGGASSLFVAPGVRLIDIPEFPEAYKSEARWGIRSLELLRGTPEALSWTYFSPPPEIGPGERTGAYQLGGDEVAGPSISYADYAVALLDELENPKHPRARFTAATATG
jgi:putative NADH-flavin reductase